MAGNPGRIKLMEVTVNGKRITLDDGSSVLDAINISGTPISQLCKDPDMKPIGACRTCLVPVSYTHLTLPTKA